VFASSPFKNAGENHLAVMPIGLCAEKEFRMANMENVFLAKRGHATLKDKQFKPCPRASGAGAKPQKEELWEEYMLTEKLHLKKERER
jgi:hypothetical protein